MNLREAQKPLKDRYRANPDASRITLVAHGGQGVGPSGDEVRGDEVMLIPGRKRYREDDEVVERLPSPPAKCRKVNLVEEAAAPAIVTTDVMATEVAAPVVITKRALREDESMSMFLPKRRRMQAWAEQGPAPARAICFSGHWPPVRRSPARWWRPQSRSLSKISM